MKPLPIANTNYANLYEMAMAAIRSRVLMAGIDLGLYDEITTFRSSFDVASSMGTHAGNTERLLDAMATIGLVEKKNGLFRNLAEANDFLVKGSST